MSRQIEEMLKYIGKNWWVNNIGIRGEAWITRGKEERGRFGGMMMKYNGGSEAADICPCISVGRRITWQ